MVFNDFFDDKMMKRTSKNVITPDKLSLVLDSLQVLQHDQRFADVVVPIIERTSEISLRTLEYFVITFCKKYRVSYRVNDRQLIFYYPDYKANLTSFPKKLFDPFRRTEEEETIQFPYGADNKVVQTTVGQLNFFKWALQFRVIEYVQQHLNEIQNDMKEAKVSKKKSSTASSVSLAPLSQSGRKKRKQTQEEWPIHGIDSPAIPTQGWHSTSPSSIDE